MISSDLPLEYTSALILGQQLGADRRQRSDVGYAQYPRYSDQLYRRARAKEVISPRQEPTLAIRASHRT